MWLNPRKSSSNRNETSLVLSLLSIQVRALTLISPNPNAVIMVAGLMYGGTGLNLAIFQPCVKSVSLTAVLKRSLLTITGDLI